MAPAGNRMRVGLCCMFIPPSSKVIPPRPGSASGKRNQIMKMRQIVRIPTPGLSAVGQTLIMTALAYEFQEYAFHKSWNVTHPRRDSPLHYWTRGTVSHTALQTRYGRKRRENARVHLDHFLPICTAHLGCISASSVRRIRSS